MRWSLLFLILFIAELTLDSSTSFVRAHAPLMQRYIAADTNIPDSTDESIPRKAANSTKVVVEVPAHAALPLISEPVKFWIPEEVVLDREITVPFLNPPRARIERPPIS
ncbi:MAG: hypothetical protein ACXVAX_02700 [Pseudobdellovibrio sp.]